MGADIRVAVGYQILIVFCETCGHTGHVDPKRATAHTRFRCRRCGSRRSYTRLVWHEGTPPDNVVTIERGPKP